LFTLKTELTALLKTALTFKRGSLLKKTFVLQQNMSKYLYEKGFKTEVFFIF
jgi:hypothetical protein